MVIAQDLREFLNGSIRHFLSKRGAIDAGEPSLCCNAFHHGRVGRYNHVVLIHSPAVVPLSLQYANNGHGNTLETNGLTNRVNTITEQFGDNGLSDDYLLGSLTDVLLRKAVTFLHLPELDVKIVGCFTIDGCRGVVVSVYYLSA